MIRLRHVGLERAGAAAPNGAGRPALLSDITLDIGAGEFRWLLGASGAGKTSLLRIMAMGERPTSGSITLFGTETTRLRRGHAPRLRRRIGVVYQDFRLLSELSVFDNVALPLRLSRRADPLVRDEVQEMLGWLGLGGRGDALPRELSGGEQQRVAIARAVVGRPALLLADEPTGNLDDAQAERVLQLFVELHRFGSTVVVATHNTALVQAFPAPQIRLAGGCLEPPHA